jgi:MFS family permease
VATGGVVTPSAGHFLPPSSPRAGTNGLPQSIAPAIAPAIIALGAAISFNGYQLLYLIGAVIALLGAVFVVCVVKQPLLSLCYERILFERKWHGKVAE